ncbi:hypothetical protein Vadar_034681 [Vaccinium darrowii]|uniref:Uncharacterized protein n=1 Tax=Vaccinium darrowii TaxID=229202 RepID=A0ACB7YS69_9ERIC|nr:hypothetical protein Vadar_034681 [Vaccinium darrowii]
MPENEKPQHSSIMNHIELISKLRHRNLFSACYLDDSGVSRLFLVFEYVSNGYLRSWKLVAEAASKVPGVRVSAKKLDILLQLRDNDGQRQKFVLQMQGKKDCIIFWKEVKFLSINNVGKGTEVTFSHKWVRLDGAPIPVLKVQYD